MIVLKILAAPFVVALTLLVVSCHFSTAWLRRCVI